MCKMFMNISNSFFVRMSNRNDLKMYYHFSDAWADLVPEPYKTDLVRMTRFERLVKLRATLVVFKRAGCIDSSVLSGGRSENKTMTFVKCFRYKFNI